MLRVMMFIPNPACGGRLVVSIARPSPPVRLYRTDKYIHFANKDDYILL